MERPTLRKAWSVAGHLSLLQWMYTLAAGMGAAAVGVLVNAPPLALVFLGIAVVLILAARLLTIREQRSKTSSGRALTPDKRPLVLTGFVSVYMSPAYKWADSLVNQSRQAFMMPLDEPMDSMAASLYQRVLDDAARAWSLMNNSLSDGTEPQASAARFYTTYQGLRTHILIALTKNVLHADLPQYQFWYEADRAFFEQWRRVISEPGMDALRGLVKETGWGETVTRQLPEPTNQASP